MVKNRKRIVIIGNGFGGVYTLKNLRRFFKSREDVHLSMIGEKNYFLFTPLLHEVATGSINPENIIEPIRELSGCCIDEFYLGRADRINTKTCEVQVGSYTIGYDYLVIASGSETNFYDIKGAKEKSLTLKSLEDSIKIKNHILKQFEKASQEHDLSKRKALLSFVVVGGGPTGVELSAEICELVCGSLIRYYKKKILEDVSITLIQKGESILPQFNKKIRDKSLSVLVQRGVKVILNRGVVEVSEKNVILDDGAKIDTESVIWVAGIKPVKIDFDTEVLYSKDGKLIVDKYLRLEGHKNIFALGDVALFTVNNTEVFLPALAQVAEKESISVAENIFISIENGKLKTFTYKETGTLISLGRWMALGEVLGVVFWGKWVWWLWRTVYLFKMISLRKKFKVAIDWTIDLFSPRDISEF